MHWGSRWAAAAVVLAFTLVTLLTFEVRPMAAVMVTGYMIVGITVPGMLVWRALRRRTDVFYLDAACGFATGCAIQLAVYLPGRWLGFPRIVLVVPLLILALFAAVPALRRWWRGSPAGSVSGAWVLAAAVVLGVALLAADGFRGEPFAGRGSGYMYVDMPFHLALAGELKHHVPALTPYVHELPLQYHWFAHAHVGATSWATGVENEVLLRRFLPLTMMIACAVGTAGLAQSWARRTWVGPAAAVLLISVGIATVLGWVPLTPSTLLDAPWWASPSQSFAQVMVIPVVALLVGIVRGRRMPAPGVWVLFVALVLASTATKATMLPLMLAAACMACGSWLVFRRRLHVPSLTALGIVFGALLFAQFVIFGGASQGTALRPFGLAQAARAGLGFDIKDGSVWPVVGTVVAVIVYLYGSAFPAAGMVAFGRRLLTNPGVAALFGIAIAGQGAALMFVQHGSSERYFVRSAQPIMAAAAIWGVAVLLRRFPLRAKVLTGVAFTFGPVIAYSIGTLTWPKPRPAGPHRNWEALRFGLGPVVGAIAAAAVLGVLLWLVGRSRRIQVPALLLTLVVIMGMGAVRTVRVAAAEAESSYDHGLTHVSKRRGPGELPVDARRLGRWVRGNSTADEVIATNGHCRIYQEDKCDARAFWIAGMTERRVLLEGWAYTVQSNLATNRLDAIFGPFWDPELQRVNDAVFSDPGRDTARVLKDQYDVDLLVVDERIGFVDEKKMSTIADRVFEGAEVEVWRLR